MCEIRFALSLWLMLLNFSSVIMIFQAFDRAHVPPLMQDVIFGMLELLNRAGVIEIDIRGNAFCMNMVRIMAGTLIEVGKGKRSALSIKAALIGKDRTTAGVTAKAHGLTLETIYYPDNLSNAGISDLAQFPRYPVSPETWNFLPSDIDYGPL